MTNTTNSDFIDVTELKDDILALNKDISNTKIGITDATAELLVEKEDQNEQGIEHLTEALSLLNASLEEDIDERSILIALLNDIEEINEYAEAIVVNDDFFEAYIRDWTMDVYGIDINAFPFEYINWDNAIAALKQQDYRSIQWMDTTFWVKVA